MSRAYSAYLAPTGVILGLALHDVFGSMLFLIGIQNKKTAMWRVSLIAWVLVFLFVLAQLISIDYIASPYMTFNGYGGYLFVANYITNFLATIMITTLFLMRIRMFYGKKSKFYHSMIFVGIIVILAKGAGNAIGATISYEYAIGVSPDPQFHPWYHLVALVMAVAMSIEGIFSAIGSVSFLYYLTDFESSNDWDGLRTKIFKKEGGRLTVIICAYAVIVYMAVWVVFDDNYVSHTGFYLPSLAYALELYTFLHISYNSPKTIMAELSSSKDAVFSKEYSSKESKGVSNDYPTPVPMAPAPYNPYDVRPTSPRDRKPEYPVSPVMPEKSYKYFPERSRGDSIVSTQEPKYQKTYQTRPISPTKRTDSPSTRFQ
jgi:hypothetical protein